jgi:WD40 repeat protein
MHLFSGHTKVVRAVAYTPSGHVVSGGDDKTVRVWSPSGLQLQVIKAPSLVYAVAASPDDKTIAYAGRYERQEDGLNTVGLWDYERGEVAGQHVWRMGHSSRSIWSLSFSSDGTYLAAACRFLASGGHLDGGGAHWWRMDGSHSQANVRPANVYAVCFAPSGTALAVTRENLVSILDKPEGEERASYALPSTWAAAVVFALEGRIVVIAANSYVLVGESTGGPRLRRVKTGMLKVTALAVSPDGRTLLVGGRWPRDATKPPKREEADRTGRVERYDAERMALQGAYDFGLGGINGLAFAPDGFTFAVAGDKGLAVCDAEF